jgi:Zn-dependent protease
MQVAVSTAYALVAVVLHEMAHAAMALGLGIHIYEVGLSWKGPFIRREFGTGAQNLAITLAGPGVNLLLALLLFRISPIFALSNAVLGIFNLLPIPHSDGARAIHLLKDLRCQRSGMTKKLGREHFRGAAARKGSMRAA